MKRTASGCRTAGWKRRLDHVGRRRDDDRGRRQRRARRRNATATGTTKNASRAWENAPPDRIARTLIATMSTEVVSSANRGPAGAGTPR